MQDTFSEIDPVPLGSASIGQVHRARLKSTGQEVAVKVQYPEVQVRRVVDSSKFTKATRNNVVAHP